MMRTQVLNIPTLLTLCRVVAIPVMMAGEHLCAPLCKLAPTAFAMPGAGLLFACLC